jgi:pyruvate dehydrogenase (quinone)
VGRPSEIDAAIDEALAADRPFVLDVITDPNVPTLPPHITLEQAASYAQALIAGDPDAGNVLRRSLANLFPSFGKKGN